jgi:hypothetical protein
MNIQYGWPHLSMGFQCQTHSRSRTALDRLEQLPEAVAKTNPIEFKMITLATLEALSRRGFSILSRSYKPHDFTRDIT